MRTFENLLNYIEAVKLTEQSINLLKEKLCIRITTALPKNAQNDSYSTTEIEKTDCLTYKFTIKLLDLEVTIFVKYVDLRNISIFIDNIDNPFEFNGQSVISCIRHNDKKIDFQYDHNVITEDVIAKLAKQVAGELNKKAGSKLSPIRQES